MCKIVYKFLMLFLHISHTGETEAERKEGEGERKRLRNNAGTPAHCTHPQHPQKARANCMSNGANFWREHGRKRVRFPSAVT